MITTLLFAVTVVVGVTVTRLGIVYQIVGGENVEFLTKKQVFAQT